MVEYVVWEVFAQLFGVVGKPYGTTTLRDAKRFAGYFAVKG